MPRKPKPEYTGVLTEPMKLRSPGFGFTPATAPEEVEHYNYNLYLERIKALYEHYGAKFGEPDTDMKVILGLADDHVPGFRIAGKPIGAPKKWHSTALFELYADVKVLMRRRSLKARSACSILAKSPRYKGQKPATLYRRFTDVRKTIPENSEHANRIIDNFSGSAENVTE